MLRLIQKADPDMFEPKKVTPSKGIKVQLFAGLVRNHPLTLKDFTKDVTIADQDLQVICQQCTTVGKETLPALVLWQLRPPTGPSTTRVDRSEELQLVSAAPPTSVADVILPDIREVAVSEPPPQQLQARDMSSYPPTGCRDTTTPSRFPLYPYKLLQAALLASAS